MMKTLFYIFPLAALLDVSMAADWDPRALDGSEGQVGFPSEHPRALQRRQVHPLSTEAWRMDLERVRRQRLRQPVDPRELDHQRRQQLRQRLEEERQRAIALRQASQRASQQTLQRTPQRTPERQRLPLSQIMNSPGAPLRPQEQQHQMNPQHHGGDQGHSEAAGGDGGEPGVARRLFD